MFVFSFCLSIRAVLEVLWKGERWIPPWPGPDRQSPREGPHASEWSWSEDPHIQKLGTSHWGRLWEALVLAVCPPGVLHGCSLPGPVATGPPPHYNARGGEGHCLWSEVPVDQRVSLTREGSTETQNQIQTSVKSLFRDIDRAGGSLGTMEAVATLILSLRAAVPHWGHPFFQCQSSMPSSNFRIQGCLY